MAEYISALDNYTLRQIGEKGHVEYGWSNNIREKIVQFHFQLTRTKTKDQLKKMSDILYDILFELKTIIRNKLSTLTNDAENMMAKSYLSIMYKMIGQTRDIVDGKGEYELTYMMILTWYKICPELAFYALDCCVSIDNDKHPYGSWKDIKYFCNYCKEQGLAKDHYLIHHAITIANKQLRLDFTNYEKGIDDISLIAKWLPREKSNKFGWLFHVLASNYFSNYLTTSTGEESMKRAILKCKTDYRKILSLLNAKLDTLQIKQCANTWATIDFKNVTSISLTKQKTAFLNKTKIGKERYPERGDRIVCANNFKTFVSNSIKNNNEIKGKRLGMNDFTKEALQIRKDDADNTEYKLLNAQWKSNSLQTKQLGKMIAMVDVSGSMDGDPLYTAIALGIRIAEKSVLGKRVLTFSSSPKWVNLEGMDEFVDMVHVIKKSEWGMNTNFNAALDMILGAILTAKLNPEDVEDLTLVILSDMQIDQADTHYSTMYENIRLKYSQTGIRACGIPYKPPHILFWNLRNTSGFPTLSSQPNTSMMSGFSPSLLNLFCDQGLEALQTCTPWSNMEKSLNNTRYQNLEDKLNHLLPIL
jgi:hypothetical protein